MTDGCQHANANHNKHKQRCFNLRRSLAPAAVWFAWARTLRVVTSPNGQYTVPGVERRMQTHTPHTHHTHTHTVSRSAGHSAHRVTRASGWRRYTHDGSFKVQGDKVDTPEVSHVVQMLVLNPEKAPHRPTTNFCRSHEWHCMDHRGDHGPMRRHR